MRKIAPWLLLLVAVAVTVGPAEIRFSTGLPLKVERFLATGVVTGAFVVAYPRRAFWIGAGAVVLVLSLESLQYFVPGRHGSAVDAAVKVLGSLAGVLTGQLAALVGNQRKQPSQT